MRRAESAQRGYIITGQKPHRSTGLGRSIVGAMATRLGADAVYDPAHSGTRVVITFECSAAPAA